MPQHNPKDNNSLDEILEAFREVSFTAGWFEPDLNEWKKRYRQAQKKELAKAKAALQTEIDKQVIDGKIEELQAYKKKFGIWGTEAKYIDERIAELKRLREVGGGEETIPTPVTKNGDSKLTEVERRRLRDAK